MDAPEYILTDEMETIVAAVKTALGLSVLNYQYGYITELNETLKQMEAAPAQYQHKFPLVYLAEPFTISRGEERVFGTAKPDLFIINTTDKTWKAKQRMDNNYKPVLLPVYRQLLEEIKKSPVFQYLSTEKIVHTLTKGYYWGENQQSVLNDAVDCLKIGGIELPVTHKSNCLISNF